MLISWKKKKTFKPKIVLDKINNAKIELPDGSIAFTNFDLYENLPILKTMIDFPENVIEPEKNAILQKAIMNIKGSPDPDGLMTTINEIYKASTATTENIYHVLTSISIACNGLFTSKSVQDSQIIFFKKGYPRLFKCRQEVISNSHVEIDPESNIYTKVLISTKAKSPQQAFTKALTSLDLIRAFWCLKANSSMQVFGDSWKPINKIRLGNIHTVHNADGSCATNSVWHEPNFVSTDLYVPKSPVDLRKETSKLLNALSKLKYQKYLIDALLRYVRALDEKDQNTAFIKLWGALEAITTPGVADYESLIRRSAFIFRDHLYHEQVLEHLRLCRNQNIHAGDLTDDARDHCYHLQYYLLYLVYFHLGSTRFFKNIAEAFEFLDFTHDKQVLLNRQRLIAKAIKFVS